MIDILARLTAVVVCLLGSSPAWAGADTYIYDALGRLKTVIYANGITTNYTYDAAGNLKAVVTVATPPATWGSFNWNGAIWRN